MKIIKLTGALVVLCLISSLTIAGELAGTLGWSQRLNMGTLVSGVVQKIAVKSGQHVRKGELLLSLDSRGYRAQVASAKAVYKLNELLLEEANRENERADELYERTVLSEHERVQSTIELRSAQASAAKAKAALTQARLNLERSQLRAPFDGVVLSVNAVLGQVIVSDLQSDTLLTLANNKQMRFEANASAQTVQDLQQIDKFFVEVAGQKIAAEKVQIALEPIGGTQSSTFYPLQVTFSLPENMQLRLGDSARLVW